MHPTEVLERLVELQKCDGALDQLAREKQAVQDEIGLFQVKVKALEDQMLVGKKRQEEIAKARKTLEIEVGTHDTKIAKYQTQLLEVKSNDQFHALQHEIEEAKTAKAQLEEKVLEAMFRDDEVKVKIQALALRIDTERKKLADERKTLDAKLADLEKAAGEKAKERETLHGKAREELPNDLEGYDAIRRSGKKVAVARVLNREICEGCHRNVPAQTFNEIRLGIQLVRCSCGRYLYEAEGEAEG